MSPLTFLLWVGVIALAVLVLGFVWFIIVARFEALGRYHEALRKWQEAGS